MRILATAISVAISGSIHAAGITGNNIEEITVLGTSNVLTGNPQSATEGIVFGAQLHQRPISRPAELLELVPGLIATQHSGEGKGNQYFLRGFNLDHGTDLAIKVDGLPVNMPSHAHGQGYADLNFLIPELVEVLSYRKGPYYAEIGDFGTAGSSEFIYADVLERGTVTMTAGGNDYRRIFAGQSFEAFSGNLTVAGAVTDYAGPWVLDQNLDKKNALVKYHQVSGDTAWSITAMGYDNTWDSTDQIPLRAVESGALSRFGNIDPSDGGKTHRHSLSFDWIQDQGESRLTADGYVIDYGLDLFSNFTYFLEDPVRGDQFEQAEDRTVFGFNIAWQRDLSLGQIPSSLTLGLQNRSDNIDLGLYKTQQRMRHTITREDDVQQSLTSPYVSLEQEWSETFRSVASVRFDRYATDVDADMRINGGVRSQTLTSPKLNLIYSPTSSTEYFVSAGQGFHSNDARGTTIRIDPVSGVPADSVDLLAKARSTEIGMRTSAIANAQIAVSMFSMKLDSELLYVGDAGATEALGASKRRGIEIGAIYAPTEWLLVDTDLTFTKARLTGVGADDRIPNSVDRTASLGLIVNNLNNWSGGLRVRYLGEAPLIEDNSMKSDSTFLLNAQTTYQINANWSVGLEVMNLLDSNDNDITYFYESRLAGEAMPQDDIHFHPVEPRSVRLTVQARF
ncbi:MAG: TonB-dependent receptor [Gammaproteobacteria bacterium]|nr:TonB-dependent receptor [Gammaproteobacteria bacterium]MDP2347546.1 TonB-dependent receptor [Gammaproteobacteria bacterium]